MPRPGSRLAARLLLATLALGAAACERAPSPDARVEETPRPAPPPPPPPPPPPTATAPSADTSSERLGLAVRRLGERRYRVFGVSSGVSPLELSVEDGHYVLYGPTRVPVQDGRFSLDVELGETERDQVFAYLADPMGREALVLAIPLNAAFVRAGAAFDTAAFTLAGGRR